MNDDSLFSMVDVLVTVRDCSIALGHAYAYADCLGWAREDLAALEDELTRNPDDPIVLASILYANRFIKAFEGAPQHYKAESARHTAKVLAAVAKNGPVSSDLVKTILKRLREIRTNEHE